MRQASSLEDFDFRPVIKQTFVNNAIDLDSSSSQFRGLSNGGPVTNSLVKVQYCCLLQSGKQAKAQNYDDQIWKKPKKPEKTPTKIFIGKNVLGTYRPTTACRNKLVKSFK